MKRKVWTILGVAVGLLGLGAPLATAGPARTDTTTQSVVYLNPGQVGLTATGFGQGGCAATDQDVWHFVAPGSKAGFVSLRLDFDTDGNYQTVEASYYLAGPFGPPSDKHAYLYTDAGLTLVGGVATVTGDTTGFFVLSGACAAQAAAPQ